jgi:hypothetical protein
MHYAALHPESRALLSSWEALNGFKAETDSAGAGSSGSAEPAGTSRSDAKGMVERLFLAQRLGEGVFTFKTVGAALRGWTGRDLRDHDVATLVQGSDRALLRALLDSAVAVPGPALARLSAFGAGPGQRQEVELVLLPLIERGHCERILGLFQPLSSQMKVSRPVLRFALTALLPPLPTPPERPKLRLVASND